MNSLPIAVTSATFFWWFGKVRSMENTIEGDHGKSFASAACKPRQPPYLHPRSPLLVLLGVTNAVRWLLEEDDGEAESVKSEMMVASSVLL